jgi:hypothetical protein
VVLSHASSSAPAVRFLISSRNGMLRFDEFVCGCHFCSYRVIGATAVAAPDCGLGSRLRGGVSSGSCFNSLVFQ